MSNIPNSPEDRKVIREAFEQISTELTTIHTSKSQIKEILKALEDKYKMPKRTLKKVAMLYHRQTAMQFESEAAEIKYIYKSITS